MISKGDLVVGRPRVVLIKCVIIALNAEQRLNQNDKLNVNAIALYIRTASSNKRPVECIFLHLFERILD